jgi:hypothetical protein
MSRTTTLIVIGLLVAGISVAMVLLFGSKTGRGTARFARLRKEDRVAAFVARFDSLTDIRLYPAVWRSGTFLKTGFDEDRREWTLTVSMDDWKLRDASSKRDLAATLFANFQGVREQAGGDPEQAVLIIKNGEGDVLLKATHASGVIIRR